MIEPLEERLAIKRWLKKAREDRGLTPRELASLIGTSPKTVYNAESEEQDASLPSGVHFYRLTRELGLLAETPASGPPTLADRLEELSASAEAGREAAAVVLEKIAASLARIEARLELGDEQDRTAGR